MKNFNYQKYYEKLKKHVKGKKVVYVDVPVHFNFGDYLIYLGSKELLKGSNVKSCYFFSCIQLLKNLNLISKLRPDVIICHGGGNFGDIYDRHNDIRLKIVENFPDIPIVFFPQTVFYNNRENLEYDTGILKKHKNLKIYVRDVESKKLLEAQSLLNVDICCDTAHFLYNTNLFNTSRNSKPTAGSKLNFNRKDDEIDLESGIPKSESIDWDYFFPESVKKVERVINSLSVRASKSVYASKILILIWEYYMSKKVLEVLEHFSKFETIETDRLHGYILAKLLDRNAIAQDNSYGKIHRYKNTFNL